MCLLLLSNRTYTESLASFFSAGCLTRTIWQVCVPVVSQPFLLQVIILPLIQAHEKKFSNRAYDSDPTSGHLLTSRANLRIYATSLFYSYNSGSRYANCNVHGSGE